MNTFLSDLSGKTFPEGERIAGNTIRPSILEFIKKEHPLFDRTSALSISELNYYKEKYISEYLVREIGELNDLEQNVLSTLQSETTITRKTADIEPQPLTFGQRLADKVAAFGGSWTFILSFGGVLLIWILVNVILLQNRGFDPYPFILLNLLLSCLAALQAPIIMMSQNRQEEKDRERAKNDYMINLKSELEIRILHEKIDHLIMNQQQYLLEIQKVQIDLMEDILKKVDQTKH